MATLEELKEVVSRLNINRAPGPDGFNGAFYRASWSIIATDLLDAINNVLRSQRLLLQVNHTSICLIPKMTVLVTIEDFRPIALCTVLYRILSKLLANRLKSMLPKLVDINQSAFIHGWRIADSILLAHELCHNLHSSQGRACMCIKLDLQNTLDQIFICNSLKHMGFADT